MASAASMERRWGFLAPWCLELKDRFELSRTEDAWGDGKGSFKLIRCVEGHFTSSVQKLREAFALLAAVQHFDTDAWTFLLSRYCQIKLEMTDDILPRVVVEMNMRETSSEEIDVLSSNLEQFCGTQQREQPSLNYVQTLAVIASMDNTMSAEKPGLDINIPIRVYVEDTMPPLLTELEGVAVDAAQTAVMSEIMTQEAVEGLTGALKRIGAVTKQVQGQWESYGSDLGVLPGSTRCTFVLEPTSLKFHGYGMTSKMMKRMHSSVLRDVPFSQMDLAVGVYKYTMDDQNVARKELGALMARMFNCGEPATDDVAKPQDLINENAILRCCPNMQELSFCKGLVHVQFNFDGSSTNPRQLPDLSTNWNDPGALMAQLSDPDSIITKCLRWLRIYISPETIIGGSIGRDRRNDEADLNALLVMLEKNKKLEYLDVIAPVKFQGYLDQFKKHHLEPIERALKLPKENKIAFLGVLSARKTALEADKKKRFEASSSDSPLGELDQDVFSNIFSFAGPPMLREVSLRVGYNYDIFRKVWYM
ncbi:hypothetical protein PHYBOEH_007036 [Phytophthora boehmeriae]|uniref:Uncharacterized protein n=1 Tax=Phytophthora boehmeriae TaxID=109152 RepID=A0A8T1WAW4_9STRA|nr:hypothetical protein PHYBOEH_007036 [Phytophthora boehmeriae]